MTIKVLGKGWSTTLLIGLVLVCLLPGEWRYARAQISGFVVDETADAVDVVPGDGVCATTGDRCTLRAAVVEANALTGASTIVVPAGVFKIELAGSGEDRALSGDFDVTGELTIRGAGPGMTHVQGAGLDRVFDVHPGAHLTLEEVRVRRGTVWGEDGGGVRNRGTLALNDVIVSSNKVFDGRGGGIFGESGSSTSATNTTVWHNKATNEGGAAAGDGGGIVNLGVLTLANATVSNNQAVGGAGGGLLNRGSATVRSSTFSANAALPGRGGGLHNVGSLSLESSILADSLAGGDCVGGVESLGHNLIEDPASCQLSGALEGNIQRRDPRFAALIETGPNAGAYELLPDSPAIDAGSLERCMPTDQRGTPRPQDGDGDGLSGCDIGAYEHPRATRRP